MRIFYFPSFYPSERPSERWVGAFTHRQVRALKQLGVDVIVVVPQIGFPVWPFYHLFKDWKEARKKAHPIYRTYEGVEIYHPVIPNRKPNRLFGKPFDKLYKDVIQNLLSNLELDCNNDYFFAQWLPEAGHVVEIGKSLGIKTTILAIGDDVLKLPYVSQAHLKGFKKTWEDADIRGVVADFLGKEANRIAEANLPYKVFYSSVDFNEFFTVNQHSKNTIRKNLGLPIDKIIILTVGSPIIRKGWLDLFDALKIIKKSNSFILVGIHGGNAEIDLNAEVFNRGLESHWYNVGEVSPSQMHLFYKAADIFCLPSHWEGLANSILEAMASKLAVVTTPVSGHPEVITDGVNGLFAQAGNVKELTLKLKSVIENVVLREKLGSMALETSQIKPGSHTSTAKYIIEEMLALKC